LPLAVRAQADAGDLSGALRTAKQLLREAGPSLAIYELLGTLHVALGDFGEAREAFSKVVYLQPDHEEALLQLAMIYAREGNRLQAARYRRRAFRAHGQTR
jgi:chemotaxis protein methyltransferase WspC